MDSLSEPFNRQAIILFIPLWILLILDIVEKQEKKRRKCILRLDREFNAEAMKQSRNRYRQQVTARTRPTALTRLQKSIGKVPLYRKRPKM